ncbi:SRPBCC family protein [Plantactinospora sp. B6F1]|uniref:SRPBCC family protein n=1 Tax=Plantactinospora sp. B6F1 TaxID=3158971 RepID=UPI00102BBA2F
MAAILSTIEIERPPDAVFGYATDPSRFPEWQRDVLSVHLDQEGPIGVGTRFTTIRHIAGAERGQIQEVTESDFPHHWASRGIDGPIRAHASITIEPVDGGARSRVTFALEFEGHGVGVPILPLVRRQYRRASPRSFQNLKDLLEGGRVR